MWSKQSYGNHRAFKKSAIFLPMKQESSISYGKHRKPVLWAWLGGYSLLGQPDWFPTWSGYWSLTGYSAVLNFGYDDSLHQVKKLTIKDDCRRIRRSAWNVFMRKHDSLHSNISLTSGVSYYCFFKDDQ